MRTIAVITGGGAGTRMNSLRPKQFIPIAGKMLIEHTLETFEHHNMIDGIIIVLPENELDAFKLLQKENKLGKKVTAIIAGGTTRQDSVRLGLEAIGNADYAVIHDAARCLVTKEELTHTIQKCIDGWQGAICALPVRDTLKRVDGETILATEPREQLWGMQTPQVFEFAMIKKAYQKAKDEKFNATDDAQVAERAGAKICVVPGKSTNIKVTYVEDLALVEMILMARKDHIHL